MTDNFGKLSDLGDKQSFIVVMTHEEILKKAIQKAMDGGWKWHYKNTEKMPVAGWIADYNSIGKNSIYRILFDHDFAKALWGERHDCNAGYHKKRKYFTMPATGDEIHEVNLDYVAYCLDHKENWQYHLQQMVIAEDPIAYLGENI